MERSARILFPVILLMILSIMQIPSQAQDTQIHEQLEVKFGVYPNGVVELAGEYFYNYTSQHITITGLYPNSLRFSIGTMREDDNTFVV
ncbi:MAG: hypothetical protein QXX94_03580 [Candidatus Bathyarchaeia archaeon]